MRYELHVLEGTSGFKKGVGRTRAAFGNQGLLYKRGFTIHDGES